MKKYVIFGAGVTGQIAVDFLGYWRVDFFADNNRYGKPLYNRLVVSFSEMLEMLTEDHVVVVASDLYHEEMEQQLIQNGVKNYFVFQTDSKNKLAEFLPCYNLYGKCERISYTQILSDYKISKYKKIAIYGTNEFFPLLLVELSIQNRWDNIVGVISETGEDCNTLGLPFLNLEEVSDSIDCLIVNARRTESAVRETLETTPHGFDVVDIHEPDRFQPAFYHPELVKFKDIHKGKRIFLIGNGPSLRVEDLDTLHRNHEICFGFNMIYKIFDETEWRPQYLAMIDGDLLSLRQNLMELLNLNITLFLSDRLPNVHMLQSANVNKIHTIDQHFAPNYPGFSGEIITGVYGGWTVTYEIGLQVAAYMGACEIYLLGVDNCAKGSVGKVENHFIPNYMNETTRKRFSESYFEQMKTTRAYEKAERYSRQHGFRIFNATRGGELEAFERVDFDTLFER